MSQEDLQKFVESFLFKHEGVYFQRDLATPESIDAVGHFEIRESDVFLVTYPKSGTIWTQQILSLIFNEGHRSGTEAIKNADRAPWIEYNVYNMDYDKRPSPRLFSSHLPHYLMPRDMRNRKGKVIYVSRNPKDVLVSFYHFHKMMEKIGKAEDFETFFNMFISGLVFSGSWFDHIKGWYTHSEDYNILFLTYEDMKMDLRSAVLKICKFVEIELDEEAVNIVVEKATFRNMKRDPLANYTFLADDLLDHTKGDFVRKGIVGDWKNTLTVAQNEMFDKLYKEKMKDFPISFVWDLEQH
ncbi:amine sulfotransferase [Bombina bombina]|uniref:amine sulfotransferase n=1 Tax=Bombina bombina TaxID=8345 RepID=UPI00235AE75F|nr:amine sulfotransferase [Bombina bombina]XP_053566788.1 amine sulfotransferase [Bombina bombina]